MSPRIPQLTGPEVQARILELVRLSPMTAGEMRRRFGARRGGPALEALVANGLVVRDAGGHYWPTPAGRIAARGSSSEARP